MLLGEVSDTAIILAVILVNALVGVIQEDRAQKALDALKQLTFWFIESTRAARCRPIWSSFP